MHFRKLITLSAIALLIILTGALAACGGGSSTPDPGGQQQATQADPPDDMLIVAVYDSVSNALTITGAAGSVLANAFVDVEDAQAYSATVQADASGAFVVNQSDLPTAFWTTPGTQIEISQRTSALLPSNSVLVTIGP